MKDTREKDAVLALISTLSVIFVVLFFSLVYFVNLRGRVAVQEARIDAELAPILAEQRSRGDVAGYKTEEPVNYGAEEFLSE